MLASRYILGQVESVYCSYGSIHEPIPVRDIVMRNTVSAHTMCIMIGTLREWMHDLLFFFFLASTQFVVLESLAASRLQSAAPHIVHSYSTVCRLRFVELGGLVHRAVLA